MTGEWLELAPMVVTNVALVRVGWVLMGHIRTFLNRRRRVHIQLSTVEAVTMPEPLVLAVAAVLVGSFEREDGGPPPRPPGRQHRWARAGQRDDRRQSIRQPGSVRGPLERGSSAINTYVAATLVVSLIATLALPLIGRALSLIELRGRTRERLECGVVPGLVIFFVGGYWINREYLPRLLEPASILGNAMWALALAPLAWVLMELPGVESMLKAAPSKSKALEMTRQLTANGIPRLDDATLLQRAVLFSKMLENGSESSCAAMARGTPTEDIFMASMRADPEILNGWFNVSFQAALAEVQKRPAPQLNEAQIDKAVTALRMRLPADQANRVLDGLAAPDKLSDRDVCSMARTLYDTAIAMPEPDRAIVIRALTQ